MEYLAWLAWGAFIVVVVYLAVRAGSFAYFRTKLEYLRSVLKETKGK
jgi:hypothetical protein